MPTLPDLSERLAAELANSIAAVAEPYRSRLIALLKVQSRSELKDLKNELAAWLAQMETALMVRQYNQTRQIIQEAEQIFSED